MSAKQKFWLVGLALAGIGVVLAKVIIKVFDQTGLQLAAYFLGVALALAGLGIIMYGIRKR